MARRILHVDLDAFFVAVEQARDPALRGRAVIVGGDPDGRGVVATASYEARVFGVYSGMALRTAKRLAPAAIFLRGNFGEYQRVSRLFHAILADFTPLVEAGGLDEAYLDITGCEAICGEPQAAAASIRGRVRAELGLAVSVGIAGGRTVAKIASDRAKPDGVCEVAAGEEAALLAPLPLRALPMLGESTERRLSEIGLSTLGPGGGAAARGPGGGCSAAAVAPWASAVAASTRRRFLAAARRSRSAARAPSRPTWRRAPICGRCCAASARASAPSSEPRAAGRARLR